MTPLMMCKLRGKGQHGTESDAPMLMRFTRFPTIMLFPSGAAKKNGPVDFSGDRTVKGFKKFLKGNAGTPFVMPKGGKPKKDRSEL